jgi:hypothetical protein
MYKLIVLLLSFSASAFDKDLQVIRERVPYEFAVLFDSMKNSMATPAERLRFIGLSKDLNDNLSLLDQKEHIFILMKTEVIKGVLEHKFGSVRRLDVTSLLIERLEQKLKNQEADLSPFSAWIFRSIIAELRYRERAGLITARSFTPNTFDGPKRVEAQRFQRYLRFLTPWMDKMDLLTPTQFNDLVKEVTWEVLANLNERSIFFKRYASSAFGDTSTSLINIPQKLLSLRPSEIKRMQENKVPLTLQEAAQKEKLDAEATMEKLAPEDLSPLSDDLNGELQNKIEESEGQSR